MALTKGRQERTRADTLSAVLAPSVEDRTSELIFGVRSRAAGKTEERTVLIGDMAVHIPRDGHTTNSEFDALYHRGLLSHVRAQADGVAKFLRTADGCRLPVEFLISVNVSDDASAYVQAPKTAVQDIQSAGVETNMLKRLMRRKRNVHMPTLSFVESLFCQRSHSGGADLFGMEVASPSIVLPVPNTSTIRNRMGRWSVVSSTGPGRLIDPHGSVRPALQEVPWPLCVMVMDNLQLNQCILCLEERSLDLKPCDRHPPASVPDDLTIWGVRCCAHSCVLCMKSILEKATAPSQLVRMANILESGRSHDKYLSILKKRSRAALPLQARAGFTYRSASMGRGSKGNAEALPPGQGPHPRGRALDIACA